MSSYPRTDKKYPSTIPTRWGTLPSNSIGIWERLEIKTANRTPHWKIWIPKSNRLTKKSARKTRKWWNTSRINKSNLRISLRRIRTNSKRTLKRSPKTMGILTPSISFIRMNSMTSKNKSRSQFNSNYNHSNPSLIPTLISKNCLALISKT